MPSLSITPARTTEPAVGAWVWASGNQVCSGKIGTLTAKATAKPKNNQRPVETAKSAPSANSIRSKVIRPRPLALAMNTVAMIDTSMNAEPIIVYRKNFVAAYTRPS